MHAGAERFEHRGGLEVIVFGTTHELATGAMQYSANAPLSRVGESQKL